VMLDTLITIGVYMVVGFLIFYAIKRVIRR